MKYIVADLMLIIIIIAAVAAVLPLAQAGGW